VGTKAGLDNMENWKFSIVQPIASCNDYITMARAFVCKTMSVTTGIIIDCCYYAQSYMWKVW
jgi:hypothetical protein